MLNGIHSVSNVNISSNLETEIPSVCQDSISCIHLTSTTTLCTAVLYSKRHFFYVLLTVHCSIFILANNQLDAQNLFFKKFISCLYMFWALCAHRQEVKIVLYSFWYHHTCRWPSRAQVERGLSQPVHGMATYRCDDTRGCIIQFRPPDDEHMVLETCRGMK